MAIITVPKMLSLFVSFSPFFSCVVNKIVFSKNNNTDTWEEDEAEPNF